MKEYKGKQKSAKSMVGSCGYKKGGKITNDKAAKKEMATAKKGAKKAEKVDGVKSAPRADRLARGGKAKKHGKTQVNVVIAPSKDKQPIPVPVPAPAPAPGPGLSPPIGAGPIPAAASGGKIDKKYPISGGARGGMGRLQKAASAKKGLKIKDRPMKNA